MIYNSTHLFSHLSIPLSATVLMSLDWSRQESEIFDPFKLENEIATWRFFVETQDCATYMYKICMCLLVPWAYTVLQEVQHPPAAYHLGHKHHTMPSHNI